MNLSSSVLDAEYRDVLRHKNVFFKAGVKQVYCIIIGVCIGVERVFEGDNTDLQVLNRRLTGVCHASLGR